MTTRAKYARLLSIGTRQAVLLPSDVKFKGKRLSIRPSGDGCVIEPPRKPAFKDTKEWFAALHALPVSPDFLQDLLNERAADLRERSRLRRTR